MQASKNFDANRVNSTSRLKRASNIAISSSNSQGLYVPQPGRALVFELTPRTPHAGLWTITVGRDAFDGGFQQRRNPAFAMGIGWRAADPYDLGHLGFHQEHQIKRGRAFANGCLQQELVGDKLDFVIEVRRLGVGAPSGAPLSKQKNPWFSRNFSLSGLIVDPRRRLPESVEIRKNGAFLATDLATILGF